MRASSHPTCLPAPSPPWSSSSTSRRWCARAACQLRHVAQESYLRNVLALIEEDGQRALRPEQDEVEGAGGIAARRRAPRAAVKPALPQHRVDRVHLPNIII